MKEELIVLAVLAALVVIGLLLGIINKLVNKKEEQENELNLLEDIENGNGVEVSLLEKLSVRTIKKHWHTIVKANTEILKEDAFNEDFSAPEVLEVVDTELEEIDNVNDVTKEELIYEMFLAACCNFDLKTWLPVIFEMLLCINEEERYLADANRVYELMLDIALNAEEFSAKSFQDNCLEIINQVENLSPKRVAELTELVGDFIALVEEEREQHKIKA